MISSRLFPGARMLGALAIFTAVFSAGRAPAATSTFNSTGSITTNDGPLITAATPFPSAIEVSGLIEKVTKITVTLTNLSHTYPDDLDLLLVGPDGTQAMILSDVGGAEDLNGITLVLDDDAAAGLPDSTQITSGTYRPTNFATPDIFPLPAPVPNGNSALSAFANRNPNGTWKLFVVDDTEVDGGMIGSWSLNITTESSAAHGRMLISEFRLRGPGGPTDEFVEIHNATDEPHVVSATDGSAGYALAVSGGVTRFIIPNGTVIPARGHFLGVNTTGYSLTGHAAGPNTPSSGDATFATDIPDNAGIALFRTSNPTNFNADHRLDAAGSNSEANALYRENTGYPTLTTLTMNSSFCRKWQDGQMQDTGNNAADFIFVDPEGTSAGARQNLGAPGPQNLSSPLRKRTGSAALIRGLVDPQVALTAAPNRVRDTTSDPTNNATYGTLELRRKFTNQTGANITRLRFRIADLSTFPSLLGTADLRARSSASLAVALSSGGTVTLRGLSLEQPPIQPHGGGLNSTLSVASVAVGTVLAPGASADLRFLMGIQQKGRYRFTLIPETLPAASSAIWIISGDTENPALDVETLPGTAIQSVRKLQSGSAIDYIATPGIRFQLQHSTNLQTWADIGGPVPGSGMPFSHVHSDGEAQARRFYRLLALP